MSDQEHVVRKNTNLNSSASSPQIPVYVFSGRIGIKMVSDVYRRKTNISMDNL